MLTELTIKKTFWLLIILACLACFGCRQSQTYQTDQAAKHISAARNALASYDKLETQVESAWTKANTIPPTADAVAQVKALLSGINPKIARQTTLISTAVKELDAAKKLKLPSDYYTYLKLLAEAAAKEQQASRLTTKTSDDTASLLKGLPAGAIMAQLTSSALTDVVRQTETALRLSEEARKLEAQAETFRQQKNLNL